MRNETGSQHPPFKLSSSLLSNHAYAVIKTMIHRPTKRLCLAFALCLFAGLRSWALPDNLSVTATNPWTAQPAVFNLQRYNLRATNYQVRIYSDATNYTLLPTNQIPEPTTYRGRIAGDPGAFVVGTFKADGKLYYNVSYGSRWQASASNADPYDGTNRLSWGGWSSTLTTPNIPSLGYVTNAPPATNQPVHLNWIGGFNTNAPVSYGGPPYLNNLKQIPIQRVRMVLDSDFYRFYSNLAGSNITTAILMQESRINDVDFEQARDLGVCYQISVVCVRTNIQAPYTTTTGNLGELNAFWHNTAAGYSGGVGTNGLFDMVHGSVNVADAGGWAYAPGDFSVMAPDWCGFASGHEIGHNWGQGHYNSVRDYTGDNFWHITQTGSGFGHSTRDVQTALNLRRNQWKGGIEWVEYNAELPPHASPDLVTTKTNTPVSINVLLNDYIGNSNALSVASFETNTAAGGVVTNLGGGVLRYTPANNFVGFDLVRYYVTEPSGLKSLTAAKVLVTSDGNPLLGHWPLNEASGSSAAETTGSGHAGALNGSASFGSGSVPGIGGGTALHLDGSGYVRFKGTWFDPLNANLTISLWCRPDDTPAGEQMLFMKSAQASSGAPGIRLGMNASSFFFSGTTHGGAASFSAKASLVPQAGVWYHVVGEIDRTSGLVRLWVNGVEYTGTSNTRTIPAGEFILGDNWPCLGMANDGGGFKSWFVGALDDLRLYTKALSSTEINTLYQGGGIFPAGGPRPYDGENNVAFQPAMTWQPGGTNGLQYRVYLGTSSNAVQTATTNSAEYKGQIAVATYIPPAPLAANTTYYWRIDEVLAGTNIVPGEVWAYSTAVDAIHGGLKLYLSLDSRDTVGNSTFDRSGSPYHDGVLLNSPTPSVGQVYESLGFNGANSCVETPALNMATSNATFLAWLKLTNTQGGYTGVIMCNGGSTWSGMMISSSGTRLGYQWNDDTATWTYNSGPVLPTNQWVLAAVSVSNSRAVFYLGQTNGVITATTNNYTHIFQAFDAPMDVGRDSAAWGRYFKGLIDEVCVWNRALSFAEFGQILTNGINGSSFGGARPAPAPGTFTWLGDSDVYWTNTLNWSTNIPPVAGSTVYFNDSANGNTATQLGTNFSIGGVNVSGGLRGMGISDTNRLTLGAGGLVATNSSAKITLAVPMTLGAAQVWRLDPDVAVTVSGAITGAGNLSTIGGGTVSLTAPGQSCTGGITVNGGTLKALGGAWASSLFANVTPRAITLNSNATMETTTHSLGGLGGSFYQPVITLNEGTTWKLNAEQYLNGANLVLKGATVQIQLNDLRLQGGTVNVTNASTVSSILGAGSVNLFGATTFNVANGPLATDFTVEVPVNSSGVQNLIKSGAGTMALTRPCTFTGTTTINGGVLEVDGGDNILPSGTTLTVTNGASFALNGNRQTVSRLLGAGAVNLGLGAIANLTSSNDTFGGIISGTPDGLPPNDYDTSPSGGLAMNGTGKLTLTNRQGYAGDTWVTAGTLALSGVGSITNSSNIVVSGGATFDVSAVTGGIYTLLSGQTLEGNGTVKGTLVVNGTVSPGHSIGILTFSNNVTLAGNTVMEISKVGASLSGDRVVAAGSLVQGGTLTVAFTGDALVAGDSFDLFDGTISGAFTNFDLPALPPEVRWSTDSVAANGILSVVPAVNATPTNITAVVSGGNLNLTWPADHIGWRLEVQTNTTAVGLRTNWFTWPNSAATNSIAVPLTPNDPAVFLRLVYP